MDFLDSSAARQLRFASEEPPVRFNRTSTATNEESPRFKAGGFFKRWGPLVLWCGLIFILSSRPSFEVSEKQVFNFLFFKTLHIIEYAVLYLMWFRALKSRKQKGLVFALTIAYAISDEIHQLFVPTREGRIPDILIDAVGGLVGWVFIKQYLLSLPPRLKSWVSGSPKT